VTLLTVVTLLTGGRWGRARGRASWPNGRDTTQGFIVQSGSHAHRLERCQWRKPETASGGAGQQMNEILTRARAHLAKPCPADGKEGGMTLLTVVTLLTRGRWGWKPNPSCSEPSVDNYRLNRP
jgi:hypothetical protein